MGQPLGLGQPTSQSSPSLTTRDWNCRLSPETLDPCTLRLLWEQRELEIQALRWAVQNDQNARYYHILQEVAGIPPERSVAKSPTQPQSYLAVTPSFRRQSHTLSSLPDCF